MNLYVLGHGRELEDLCPSQAIKTDHDVLKEEYRFIRSDDNGSLTWEQRLAKRYYEKLFKEYALADMSL